MRISPTKGQLIGSQNEPNARPNSLPARRFLTITSTLTLGNQTGSNGTYNLTGGNIAAVFEFIGNNGTGAFVQSGCWHRNSLGVIPSPVSAIHGHRYSVVS